MNSSQIDEVDYAILSCIAESDAVWKKRIHDLVLERANELPHMDSVSVQTVGRRINRLQDGDLLESCIMSPDELNRDLIIGYNLTDDGETVLKDKRDRYLKNEVLYLSEQWVVGDTPIETAITREAFLKLISDKFDLSEPIRTDRLTDCNTAELYTLTGFYFLLQDLPTLLRSDSLPRVAKIIAAAPKMQNVFCGNTIVKRLAEMAENGTIHSVMELESVRA